MDKERETGNVEVINRLILGGTDLNFPDDNGRTALHYAIHAGSFDTSLPLMIAGAIFDFPDAERRTLLSYVVEMGISAIPIIKILLEHGANVNNTEDADLLRGGDGLARCDQSASAERRGSGG